MTSFKFKTEFARSIFQQKYQMNKDETWPERCRIIVNDVCGDRSLTAKLTTTSIMSKSDQDQLVQYMVDMKFIPGGRYIYYAGRPAGFFNNCFAGIETFITDKGVRSFKECDGLTVNVLSPVTGSYVPAKVKSYGRQQTCKVEFALVKGHQHTIKRVWATRNHRWPLMDGTITDNLQVGDIVPATIPNYVLNKAAFIHGLVFADGNVHYKKVGYGHQLRLCGTKNQYVDLFTDEQVSYPEFANGDACIYLRSLVNLKELPITQDSSYIASFIEGWLAGDGHGGKVIHTINKEAIHYFIQHACLAGYVITSDLKCETKPSNFGERKPLYYVRFQHAENFTGFKVKSIEASPYIEKVYCVEEPEHTQFTLSGGIATGNCFCLKATEDTREEWAALAQRSTSALMSGGGIGVDYSILRPSGRTLARTGGISSGPIPLMHIINEIGRNVMQGGSRRSAIFASLNWQHEDIQDFIHAKDWSEDIKRLKSADFNFPAPMDMTNISVNFDTAFIESVSSGSKPTLWDTVVEQMCKTGEPGMCFNFYENEKDTLRNAYVSVGHC